MVKIIQAMDYGPYPKDIWIVLCDSFDSGRSPFRRCTIIHTSSRSTFLLLRFVLDGCTGEKKNRKSLVIPQLLITFLIESFPHNSFDSKSGRLANLERSISNNIIYYTVSSLLEGRELVLVFIDAF